MTTTTTKMTAKDFVEPLIRTLGTMTENKANRPVDFKATFDPICKMLGITLDQFGVQPDTGSQWVEKWIQWAFRDMVDRGLGVRIGRGQWALTEGGVARVEQLAGIPAVAPAVAETPATPVEAMTTTTMSLDIGSGHPEDAYHPDSYLRALAISETKCFSAYSTQSNTCGKCTLQGACINAMAAELSALARQMDAEDRQAEAAAKAKAVQANAPATPAAPAASTVAPSVGDKATSKEFGPASKIFCQQQAICRHCQQVIPKGTEAYWVRSGDGKAGLFHINCFDPSK